MNITIQLDPSGSHSHVEKYKLIDACGLIPSWVLNPDYFDKPLKDALDIQYGFSLFETTGGSIDENGLFHYPGDPAQHPYIKIERGDETFYQYPHAFIAIVQKDGSSFITRMD